MFDSFDFSIKETPEGNIFLTHLKNASTSTANSILAEAIYTANICFDAAGDFPITLIANYDIESLALISVFASLKRPFKVAGLAFKNYPDDPKKKWLKKVCDYYSVEMSYVEFDIENPIHRTELDTLSSNIEIEDPDLLCFVWAALRCEGFVIATGHLPFPTTLGYTNKLAYNLPGPIEHRLIELFRQTNGLYNFFTATPEMALCILKTKVAAISYTAIKLGYDPILLTSTIKNEIFKEGEFKLIENQLDFSEFSSSLKISTNLTNQTFLIDYIEHKIQKYNLCTKFIDCDQFVPCSFDTSAESVKSFVNKLESFSGAGFSINNFKKIKDLTDNPNSFVSNTSKIEAFALFPKLLLSFEYSKDISESAKYVAGLNYTANTQNLTSQKNLHEQPELQELLIFFRDCLNQYAKQCGILINDFKIVLCWANKTTIGQSHHLHFHPNSYLSGVFYFQDFGGNIEFSQREYSTIKPHNKFATEFNADSFSVKPKAGRLLIFPSQTLHHAAPNFATGTRYSVSFNAMPIGPIGNISMAAWMQLH